MKSLTLFILFLISIVNAQNDSTIINDEVDYFKTVGVKVEEEEKPKFYLARTVSKMAIFPGCDKDSAYLYTSDENAKKQILIKCLNKKLSSEMYKRLDIEALREFTDTMGLSYLKSKIKFVINENGQLTNIERSEKGSEVLGLEGEKVLENLNSKLNKKGTLIKPAEDEEGNPVNVMYYLPLVFRLE